MSIDLGPHRERMIKNGVANLKQFGYPDVTPENIISEKLFAKFFMSMLDDNEGRAPHLDEVIDGLKKEIVEAHPGLND